MYVLQKRTCFVLDVVDRHSSFATADLQWIDEYIARYICTYVFLPLQLHIRGRKKKEGYIPTNLCTYIRECAELLLESVLRISFGRNLPKITEKSN
jgi:hypothetical protein